MQTRYLTVGALALALSVAGVAVSAHGTAHEQHAATMNQPVEAAESADIDLRDRTLVDQDGRQVKFVSDVIGDKIVVMDFVFTTCTNVCPILSAVLSQVQRTLGERLEGDIAIVSVTVDPIRDTPQRLKAYAAKHRAGEGWTWLTGPKPIVDDVLTGLGAYSVNFEDHPSMVLVGAVRRLRGRQAAGGGPAARPAAT